MHNNQTNESGWPPTDPETGQEMTTRDMREQFAELTRKIPRDPESERAFILTKIETVKRAPGLSEEERASAMQELKALLDDS